MMSISLMMITLAMMTFFNHLPGCFNKLLCVCQPLHRFGLQVMLTYDNNGKYDNNYADDGNDDIAVHYPLHKKSFEG